MGELLTNFKHFESTVLQSKFSISRVLFKISANKIHFFVLNQSKSLQVSEINLKLSEIVMKIIIIILNFLKLTAK